MFRHLVRPMYLKMFQYVLAGLQIVSTPSMKPMDRYLRALEQGNKEAGYVQRNSVEQHDVAEPFVQSRRKDAFTIVSEQVGCLRLITYVDTSRVWQLS